jgi:hypothetical protein
VVGDSLVVSLPIIKLESVGLPCACHVGLTFGDRSGETDSNRHACVKFYAFGGQGR